MSEGRVRIDLNIDTDKADSKMLRMQNSILKTANRVERLKNKMEELKNAKVPTEDYAALEKEIEKTIGKISTLQQKQDELNTNSVKGRSKYEDMQLQIEQAQKELEGLYAYQARMQSEGTAHIKGEDTEAYQRAAEQKAEAERDLEVKVLAANENIKKAGAKAANSVKRKWIGAIDKIKKVINSIAKGAFKIIGGQGLKKSGEGISAFGKRIARLAKMVFVFRLIRQAFTAMLNGMKEGINNYAQYSESFNKTMSDFKTATSTAKNALAAMVVPILSAVIPALTTLVNWITAAAGAISNLMAVISGKGTWSKAKTQATDYAKSLKGAAGASDKLKQSLAGFDDLDVLNTDDSSGGGGGVAGTNPADMWTEEEAVKPEWFNPEDWTSLGVKLGEGLAGALDMIPWDSIQEKARNTAARIAEVINGFISVDEVWTSMGHGIAEGLNTGVIVAYTLLSTINFKGLGQGLGSLINQAVSDFDWNLLGATVGAGINGIFGTILGFVTTLDWGELGSSFAESINSALSTTDWGQIAEAISGGAIGLVTSLSEFLGTLDWAGLAKDIIDFISKLDFSGLAKALSEAIGHGLAGLALFVGTLIGSALNGIADYFNDKIEEAGGDIVAGIFKGITDALDGIIDWLRENIFNPFIESFCELFGIHSPSTVFAEFGTFLIEGFLQGITDTWGKITSFFGEKFENIKKDILDFLGNIKKDWSENWQKISDKVTEIWEDMWDGMKSFLKETVNGIIGLINGMLDGLVSGINSAIRALNKLKVDIPDWVPKIGGNTFGFNIPEISAPQIPLLANGGITTGSTLAMIGEAGKEAVLPLENNTGWMEDLAEVINGLRGDRPINLQIDGKTFARLIMPFIDDESDIIGTSLSTV